ncbi:unnamed protein product [Brugia timori]|uniref:Uncharacterized protein n=1 Tax=Brugia timori TaxID=42155 RepID=A0A0R3R502_9BILA|nr:unnamed protein product [Brugia timori]
MDNLQVKSAQQCAIKRKPAVINNYTRHQSDRISQSTCCCIIANRASVISYWRILCSIHCIHLSLRQSFLCHQLLH